MVKLKSLAEAAAMVPNGSALAIGGNALNRAPMAFVRELCRQQKRGLRLIKTAAAHELDLLCAAKAVSVVDAGFVSYETYFGLAGHYRRGVESGEVIANEHACYTVICALRAASMNVPFMPVAGLKTGDLLTHNDYFMVVEDPFGGQEPVTLVKALAPDVAVIHVHGCDEEGNAIIEGPKFEDVLLSRAAKKIILTTEKIIPAQLLKPKAHQIAIPGFLVDSIVVAPKGAKPTSCYKLYDVDEPALKTFLALENAELAAYLKKGEGWGYG
ncbi:MAG: hypothetical protein FWF59_15750 [Turicibacter sp.]|nr:hypothetical protein [Turicibacter sp.]